MEGITIVGLAILSIFAVSIASLGYLTITGLIERQKLMNIIDRIANVCEEVAFSGGERIVELEVPAGCTITFQDNRIYSGEIAYPEKGLPLKFAENLPTLETGKHTIKVYVLEGKVFIWTL